MKFLGALRRSWLRGKICLLRTDFNVEIPKDALRLEASLPTLRFLLKNGARVVILSHRGRPSVKVRSSNYKSGLSLRVAIPFLKNNLGTVVHFLNDIPSALPKKGRVFLLENLRFWAGEEKNDLSFAQSLASMGDFYVNDAFAVCHRKNASVTQLPRLLPSYAGFLLEKELTILSRVMRGPRKPLVLVFGGSKMADKTQVIHNLLSRADKILLGSAAINNGSRMLKSDKILKPVDWISDKGRAMDIGPFTAEIYGKEIACAKMVVWNGPVGKFEDKRFAGGSAAIAKAIANSQAFSVVGGGETAQLVIGLGLRKKYGFLSTGGGAMLKLLAGEKLPGIEALK